MQRKDFWYSAEAESMGTFPTGTRAGQFLFLSAQASINLETGEIIRDLVDLSPEVREKLATPHHLINAYFGPVTAQTWTIYQNLSKILASHGATLKGVIRQRIFLRDPRDSGWMEKTMLSFFPDERPVTLIMGVPDRGLNEDIRVWVDVIVLVPQEGGLKKEAINLPEFKKMRGPYPSAVKVGQFLFFDGIRGVDPKTGRAVTNFDEVDPEARSGEEGLYIDSVSEAMKCQFWLTYNGHIKRLLESQGAGLKDLLDVTAFWRHGMRDLGEREYLREKLFKTPQNAPPATGFGIHNLSVIPDDQIITGGVALLPGEYQKQPLRYGDADRVGTYSSMTKGGPFWFHAGMISIDLVNLKNIVSFADLADNGRFLAQNYIDDSQAIMAKTWYIYRYMLDNVDAKASQVIHQTVYLKNASDWPAVERIANIFFKGHLPPTTIIPVDTVAFHLRYHMPFVPPADCETMEIQLWGLTE
ncbi:MAG: RidA family protein [Desulfatiglandales bacterium]